LNKNEDLYALQLKRKRDLFLSFFSEFTKDLDCFPSPISNFRTRAELGVHVNDSINFTMVENNKKIFIDNLEICDEKINNIINLLKKYVTDKESIKEKLFQAEIQVARNGEGMVSLIYHKSLDTNWIEDAQNLSSKIGVSIIGRSKKQKLVIGKDFVTETYKVKDQTIEIDLYEQCFSQTNPYICDQMLSWVHEREDPNFHITELHCGIGTFTALLSNIFSKVLATENSRPSIKALKKNLENNFITNVQFARMSGLETLEALNKVRTFNRLKHVNLKSLKRDVLFLDPPKTGLDSLSLDLIKQVNFKEIIYLSCGFPSLKSNINNLLSDYCIEKAAFFDQFPFTDHLETGVILKKRVTT